MGSELRRYGHHYVREPQDMNGLAQQVRLRLQGGDLQPIDTSRPELPGAPAEQATHVVPKRRKQRPLGLQQQLEQSLSEMSPMHAAVLPLHKRDGLSQEAIAIELQLDVATVAKVPGRSTYAASDED